jgi:hypothetical protein
MLTLGAVPCRDARTWTRAILNVPRYPTAAYRKMFLAGDTAIWVQPAGMLAQDVLDKLRRHVAKETPRMRGRIDTDAWPPTHFNTAGPIKVWCSGDGYTILSNAPAAAIPMPVVRLACSAGTAATSLAAHGCATMCAGGATTKCGSAACAHTSGITPSRCAPIGGNALGVSRCGKALGKAGACVRPGARGGLLSLACHYCTAGIVRRVWAAARGRGGRACPGRAHPPRRRVPRL